MDDKNNLSRRKFIKAAHYGVAGLGIASLGIGGCGMDSTQPDNGSYFPPPEDQGGWQAFDPATLPEIDEAKLAEAINYHDTSPVSKSHGAALVIIHKGRLICESYVTGTEGGPDNWTASTCNDMKSSTKSVFGTAAGVFLDEFSDRVTLETLLVGDSRESSLIPQIWHQPITDERKKQIKVKHVLSMTSGHAGPEPWLGNGTRRHHPGYSSAHQMYEYCFGWWNFEGIHAHDAPVILHPGRALIPPPVSAAMDAE